MEPVSLADERDFRRSAASGRTDRFVAVRTPRRQIAELESRGRLRDIIHMDRVAAVGAISASIAHELNQPLGAIMANTQAAEKLLAAKPIDHDLLKEISGRHSAIPINVREISLRTCMDC